jgi:Na+-driven multidrug efflux pump
MALAMATTRRSARVAETSVESSDSGVEWTAITAGALAAIGITIILLALGSGTGISVGRPWAFNAPSPTEFGFWVAAGMIVTQWLSSAVGGYLAGRMRKKWVGIRTDEVFFRDTAHGFLTWALATALMAALFSMVATAATVGADVAAATPSPEAQKAAADYSLFTALSFLIGAFIASAAAALGGTDRDEM